ncbi:MAG: surface carbohydrate biosynthesis protein [Nitrospirales bacterium]
MPKPRRRLILPVEIFNREFDAKVLLSCFAAERGFSVIIGAKREINLNLASFPPSIYLPINLHNRNQVTTHLLENLGHTLAGMDEEAIVYCSPEVYVKEKLGNIVFPQPKLFLAWGSENARIWKSQKNYNGMPVHITGNPRTDLLRPELQPYWARSVEDIKKQFGDIILINTNFGKLNNFRPNKGDEKKALEAATSSLETVNEQELGMAKHRLALFHHFQQMVGEVGKAFPTHTVLIRPHPSENHEIWKQAGKGCPNVHVHFEGHVTPWLLASDAIIHNSCTTGLEGYLLNRSVFSFQPVTSERFDKKLPNSVSQRASSTKELIHLLGKALSSSTRSPENGSFEKAQLVEQYLAFLNGPFASEQIVTTLENFDDTFSFISPSLQKVTMAKFYAMARKFKRRFNAQFRMSNLNRSQRYQYLQHIFPEIEYSTIQDRIDRLQHILDRFSKLKVRPLDKSIFEISLS